MKHTIIALGLSAFLSVSAYAGNDYDDYVKTPDIAAADLWKESWQVGKEYQHLATFEIDGKVKTHRKENTLWMKLWGSATEDIVGRLLLGGNANAFTAVACKRENGEMMLVRNFGNTDLQTNFYLDTHDASAADFIMKTLMTSGEIEDLINEKLTTAIAGIAAIQAYLGAATAVTVPTGGAGLAAAHAAGTAAATSAYETAKIAGKMLAESTDAGGRLERAVQEQLHDAGLAQEELDGERIYTVRNRTKASKLFGSLAAKTDFALKLAESFNNRDYLIFSDKNNFVSSKRISEKTLEDISVLQEKGQLSQNFDALKNLDGNPASDAESCFKRESLGLNEKIFGGRQRAVGDVWLADADFLNSFLHPDLKGAFKGRVLLKYEANVNIQDHWGDVFPARKLVMIQRNGEDSTRAEYEEEDFSLSLNGRRTSLEIFLDQKTLVVREVRLKAESDVRSGSLPDTVFTHGFELLGDLECNMKYHCRETELANE